MTCANGFTGYGPDVGILRLGADGCLEHLLKDLLMVSGREQQQVKAIHKGLSNADE